MDRSPCRHLGAERLLDGTGCALGNDICDPHPLLCPMWVEAPLVCPVCLEFAGAAYPGALFREGRLLEREGAFFCSECQAFFADMHALVHACLCSLKDAMEDTAHLELVSQRGEREPIP